MGDKNAFHELELLESRLSVKIVEVTGNVEGLRGSVRHMKEDRLSKYDQNFEKIETNFARFDARITTINNEQIRQVELGAQTAENIGLQSARIEKLDAKVSSNTAADAKEAAAIAVNTADLKTVVDNQKWLFRGLVGMLLGIIGILAKILI